jgi:hypothetical protein
MLLAAALIVMSIVGTTFAATNDPNMTAYNGVFTVTTDNYAPYGIFDAVPENAYYLPTFFDSYADATNGVTWSILDAGGGLDGTVDFDYTDAISIGTNEWAAEAGVFSYDENAEYYGSANVRVTNNATGASVDLTLVVNEYEESITYTEAENVKVRIDVPADYEDPNGNPISPGPTPFRSFGLTVGSGDFGEIDTRTFPTVLDALVQAFTTHHNEPYPTPAPTFDAYTPYGDFIDSITLNGNPYSNQGNSGWQYRVYRSQNDGTVYYIVPLAERVGAGDFMVQDGDLIIWRYGDYNAPGLFPDQLP